MSDASISERLDALRFFQTPEHECNYLSDREASTVFVDPSAELSSVIYSQLALIGFRRSGRYLYRPRCKSCHACIPIRLSAHDFKPNRSQRRIVNRNQDLTITICDKEFQQEHYELYERYLRSRHTDGGMDDTTPEKYRGFLTCEWMNTQFVEFRLEGKLIGVAVTDFLPDGLSALYTFFDPDLTKRSLGTFAILWQIDAAKQFDKQWIYLGYWIEESLKMAYKTRFKPYELFINGYWQQGGPEASSIQVNSKFNTHE
jgi:arginine-tRNA-protein transferase